MENLIKFFNSDFFTAISTIGTAFIAWAIYIRTKNGQKIDAARMLLSEIRNAEEQIKNIKMDKLITDYTVVLPTNNWRNYKHLFVKDFDTDGIRLIDSFYVNCELAEKQINIHKEYEILAKQEEVKIIQHKLLELADTYKDGGRIEINAEYREHKEKLLQIFHNETYWFMPNMSVVKIVGYVDTIQFVLNTPIGQKLKDIAKS